MKNKSERKKKKTQKHKKPKNIQAL